MRLFAIPMLVLASVPSFAAGAENSDKDKKTDTYALISGTVFRDTGASLPGAEVILAPSEEAGKRGREKKRAATSDARGEFAFRVPAGRSVYNLTVRAKGDHGQQKPVTTTGEDRIDVFFRLDPTSK